MERLGALFHSGGMAEQHPPCPESVPDYLTRFVTATPSVDHLLLFHTDSVAYAYSASLGMEEAEQRSALVGCLHSMANSWGLHHRLGECDSIVCRYSRGPVVLLQATPALGLGVWVAEGSTITAASSAAQELLAALDPHLPQHAPDRVGQLQHLRGALAA